MLRSAGVSLKTVENALEQVYDETPESELIEASIARRTRAKGLPKDRGETKKLFDYLLRQGFGFDLIREKLRDIVAKEMDEHE